ncbi:rRNA maturation RNase YbeY [Candidatus Xianfuyuplasma coldseepsis]|nr:rRNA maturation RNase YbeY [Xianfuyuplasma coldseepsis]
MKINIVNYFSDQSYPVIERVLQIGSKMLKKESYSITIILVDDEEITALNSQYRDKSQPTDVLTFPDGYMHHLGDVFISMETCERQAIIYEHSLERELGFLAVHGLLHTLGYDHHTPEEETEMFQLQEQILQQANVVR